MNSGSPPTLCILCGNAADNRGDRANLSAQISLLKSRFPGSRIIVGSYNATRDAQWYDAEMVPRGLVWSRAMDRAVCDADIVVWGGGALLADNACRLLVPYWLLIITYVRLIRRKPVMAWAQGIVLNTAIGKILARIVLNLCDAITVRDQGSLRTLNGIRSIRTPYTVTADPAVLIDPEPKEHGEAVLRSAGIEPGSRRVIAVAPTFWQYYHRSTDMLPYIVARRWGLRRGRDAQADAALGRPLTELCDELIARLDADIVFLPRYGRDPWPDVRILDAVRARAKHPERIGVLHGDSRGPREHFSVFRACDAVVAIALHDAIVATATDVPCLHLYYEEKGKEFFESIAAADRLRPLSDLLMPGGPAAIAGQTAAMIDAWSERRQEIIAQRTAAQDRARRNADVLAEVLHHMARTQSSHA